jgi:sulfotransferase
MKRKLYFLSGLPRSGSTLITSILMQNPDIYTESNGNSPVCNLMWDLQTSIKGDIANELITVAGKKDKIKDLMKAIPEAYYSDVKQPIIIDKCRNWTHPVNLEMILNYIDENPKIIVTTRNLVDVVKSWIYVRKQNKHPNPEEGILDEGSEPIMRAFRAFEFAKKEGGKKYLFIDYEKIVNEPEQIIKEIYDFCEWKTFKHSFKNIINTRPNLDKFYNGLDGLHDIRPEIGKRNIKVKLSKNLETKTRSLMASI